MRSLRRLNGALERVVDADQQRAWQDLLSVVIGLPAVLDRQLQRDAGISNFEYHVLARLSMSEGFTMRPFRRSKSVSSVSAIPIPMMIPPRN